MKVRVIVPPPRPPPSSGQVFFILGQGHDGDGREEEKKTGVQNGM